MNELIPLKIVCEACQGKGYLPIGETFILAGRKHNRLGPCTACDSTGKQVKWVDLGDFANLLVAIRMEKQST